MLFSTPAPRSEYENLRSAVAVYRGNMTIKRVGLTYVIEINYRSLNPDRAAQIANAVADAYVVDQLDAKFQATRRAVRKRKLKRTRPATCVGRALGRPRRPELQRNGSGRMFQLQFSRTKGMINPPNDICRSGGPVI